MKKRKMMFRALSICICLGVLLAGCSGVTIQVKPAPAQSTAPQSEAGASASAAPEQNSAVSASSGTNVEVSSESQSFTALQGTAFSIDPDGVILDAAETGFAYRAGKENALELTYDGKTWSKTDIPLSPAGTGSGCTEDSVGAFISKEKTVIAWGDPQQAGPIQVRRSSDQGASWAKSEIACDTPTTWIKLGFLNEKNGWLVACFYQMSGNETHVLYKTTDGGATWSKVDGNLDKVYAHKISGFNFIDEQTGFVSYRFDDGLFVGRTKDGGRTWEMLELKTPEAYAETNTTPLSVISRGDSINCENNASFAVMLFDEKDAIIYIDTGDASKSNGSKRYRTPLGEIGKTLHEVKEELEKKVSMSSARQPT